MNNRLGRRVEREHREDNQGASVGLEFLLDFQGDIVRAVGY